MMTDCPFHDLPRSQAINVDWGGYIIPHSAGSLCDDWHMAKALEPALNAMRAAMTTALDRLIAADESS